MAPERHPIPNCRQASLLTKTSWDSGLLTSARGSQPEINSPEETHGTPERVHRLYTQKTAAGTGEVISRSPHLGATALAKHLVT